MILTTDAKLKIKHLVTNFFIGRHMTDQRKIEYAIKRVCDELENLPEKDIKIDDGIMRGAEVAIGMIYSNQSKPEEIDGQKYMRYNDDYLSVFATQNYAKLVKCSVPMSRPNGWGDEEDWIQHPPVYTSATCKDLDYVYDTMYY